MAKLKLKNSLRWSLRVDKVNVRQVAGFLPCIPIVRGCNMETVGYTAEIIAGMSFQADSRDDLPSPDTVKESLHYVLKEWAENQSNMTLEVRKVSVI
ncbi:hypothetical protein ACFLTP_08915 [Chloroflexota bacterium]